MNSLGPRRIFSFVHNCHFRGISRGKKTKSKLSYGKQKNDPTELALKNFDQNYRPLFGDEWPLIRMALLSMQSYGALLNNYSDVPATVHQLHSIGVEDFVQPSAQRMVSALREKELQEPLLATENESSTYPIRNDRNSSLDESPDSTDGKLDDVAVALELQKREMVKLAREAEEEEDDSLANRALMGSSGLKAVDVKQESKPWWDGQYIVAPGYEHRLDLIQQMEIEEGSRSNSSYSDVDINIVDAELQISPHLRCFLHSRDSPKRLPQAKKGREFPFLQYYIMDAASVLPVLALDLRADDVVLDLCAGPGGKSLAILQTMLIGSLTANEKVLSRKRRLQEVLALCLPNAVRTSGAVRVSGLDGSQWGHIEPASYDKVLVDVPCSTDRVSATQADNNLFKVSRSRERWDLPQLQTDLLCAGLQAVKPGGTVVYSTCTMSPLQNDGVVQNAIVRCQEEFNIGTNVVDLSPLAKGCGDVFSFFPNCRYGQLVVPRITANYGPMYFARLKRTL